MQQTIIALGREYASGGRMIGQQVAQKLDIPFYDKRLIQLAAEESGLSEQFIAQAEQTKTTSFLYNISFSSKNLPILDQVFLAESQVIERVAAQGACVIVGRCADYVLRERTDCLRVFIHAPLPDRMSRAGKEYGINASDLRAYVLKRDKSRAAYYNRCTTGQWGMCRNYDAALSSALGIDTVVDTLCELAEKKEARA